METGSTGAGDLNLRNYVQVARRRWLTILLVSLLVPAISVLISLRREPQYSASSEVLVKRQDLAATLSPGQVPYTDAQTAERVIETQVQLARLPDLAQRVVDAAGLSRPLTAADLLGSSTVTAKPKSDILVFTVQQASARDARILAGIYADQFSGYRRQLDTTELDALATGVRGQLAALEPVDARSRPLYDGLQDKLRQIQTLQALQTSSAVVVRRPDTARATGPSTATLAAGGLLLGLLLGGALAFLLESLDTRVRKSKEVGDILGLPLLARLPAPPGRSRSKSSLVVVEDADSLAAEAFAFLRTNLAFANVGLNAKMIMFCSAVEQEGKSTTASNLAVSIARSGTRVVLVDLDYRRPTIHTFFGIPRSPGVTEVLQGSVAVGDAMRPVLVGSPTDSAGAAADGADRLRLTVLPAGSTMQRINIDHVVAMLDGLRDHADVVLVDAPPLLLVGEALALSARMDALVVVARLNHVRRPMLEELHRAFDGAPVRPLGFVATAAAEEPGYSHYYRQVYGRASAEESQQTPSAPAQPAPTVPESSAPVLPAPERLPVAVRSAQGDAGRSPVTPAVAPPEVDARDALRDAIFANGSQAGGAQGAGPAPTSGEGVRPRRSWAQDGPVRLPTSSPDIGETEGSTSEDGAEGDGEGAGG